MEGGKSCSTFRENLKNFGPGIITGGAGDDPAGILTYTVVGATTGFSQLWLLLLSTPMMAAVQNTAAKVATVTGKSLPEVLNEYFSKKATYFIVLLLFIANLLTIGADIDAIASILEVLTGINSAYFLVPIVVLISYLVLFKSYRVIKRVLIGFSSLLFVYVVSAVYLKPSVGELLYSTLIPRIDFNLAFVLSALGLLGTTISPYMVFWQASEEKEEHATVVQAKEVELDTVLGMVYSNVIAYAIIVSSALTLYGHRVETVRDAALSLKPVAGEYAFLLFSLGVIISGLLAVPVLAGSSAYAVADTFGWREGLENRVSDAKGFYLVFLGSLLLGDLIDLSPVTAVEALFYSQVFDGVLLPVISALLFVLGNSSILGDYRNSLGTNILLALTFLISLISTVYLFYSLL